MHGNENIHNIYRNNEPEVEMRKDEKKYRRHMNHERGRHSSDKIIRNKMVRTYKLGGNKLNIEKDNQESLRKSSKNENENELREALEAWISLKGSEGLKNLIDCNSTRHV